MPDTSTNPDGTKQVAPATKSAFDPAEEPSKGKNQDSSAAKPAEKAANNDKTDHEYSIIEGIKGLIRQHAGGSANKNEDSALNAVGAGVADAPGNNASY